MIEVLKVKQPDNKLNKADIMEWLDKLIDAYEALEDLSTYNETVRTLENDKPLEKIILFRCVEKIAECIGAEVMIEGKVKDPHLFFIYSGVKFTQFGFDSGKPV